MKGEINKIHLMDCVQGMLSMEKGSASLIISDPPYFEIKGDFDFEFNGFQDYLEFIEEQAKCYDHALADNGSILIYGHPLRIAYVQVIFDKYFTLLNSLVWEKTNSQNKRNRFEDLRRFNPVTERILFYCRSSNDSGDTFSKDLHNRADSFASVKAYMREERDRFMLARGFSKMSEFNKFLDSFTGKFVASRHYFADSQYMFPTNEMYEKLQETGFWQRDYEDLRKEYEDLRKEYEDLRKEYEDLRKEHEDTRRPFFNELYKLEDVLKYSQEAHVTKNYKHPTQKPPRMTRHIIETCTRKGDLVLVPFAGSGTECEAAAHLGRDFIGFEIDEEYHRIATERANAELSKLKLF